MDKKSDLLRPEEGHSSSSSGADTTRTRYKPLAPKSTPMTPCLAPAAIMCTSNYGRAPANTSSAPGTSVSPPELEDELLPAADLTFVNFTDPLQSKSQESRKLVRTQVMRNFAREQKKQKARAETGGEGTSTGSLYQYDCSLLNMIFEELYYQTVANCYRQPSPPQLGLALRPGRIRLA
jgi:hypothetical protein